VHGRAENEQIRLKEVFLYGVHIVSNGTFGDRFGCLAVPAGKAIPAKLNVVFNQMDLFDPAIRNFRNDTFNGRIDEHIGRFSFSRASVNGK
jgi:hypothetical protein